MPTPKPIRKIGKKIASERRESIKKDIPNKAVRSAHGEKATARVKKTYAGKSMNIKHKIKNAKSQY
jgi:hypothetical protein